jgi:hypothetical protein
MHDWRVRAYPNANGTLQPPANPEFPQVDGLVLKIMSAPCPGSRRISSQPTQVKNSASCGRTFAAIVRDPVRTTHIRTGKSAVNDLARKVLDFLAETSRPGPITPGLVAKKGELFQELDAWFSSTQHLRKQDGAIISVRIDEVAMFLFYGVLRVIVTAALCSTEDMSTDFEVEVEQMMLTSELLTCIRAEDLIL